MNFSKMTVVVGHRGVGKSSFLKRYLARHPRAIVYDLDQEIERETGQNIGSIFENFSESHFRNLEVEIFNKLILRHPELIVVGGGFDPQNIPRECHVLWLRRESDALGRIFFDRPRLNSKVSLLQEYLERVQVRERQFLKRANQIYTLPEGDFEYRSENEVMTGRTRGHLIQSLMPIHSQQVDIILERIHQNPNFVVELRSDLLDEHEIEFWSKKLPHPQILFSFRNPIQFKVEVKNWDWDISLGLVPKTLLDNDGEIKIISSHSSQPPTFNDDLILKWAPRVTNWEELQKGHQWQQQDPQRRIYFPMSEDGRWVWYRQLNQSFQNFNFVSDGFGTATDQPTFYQMSSSNRNGKGLNKMADFAAVLGSPVKYSWSPHFHEQFFKGFNSAFVAIDLRPSEISFAIPFLKGLGFKWAAITAPLKREMANNLKASELAINTIRRTEENWHSTSTDEVGLQKTKVDLGIAPHDEVVVWGGGGVLADLQKVLPNAIFYSSQTGQPRMEGQISKNPGVLIWAAQPTAEPPTLEWKPKVVWDLNYFEHSRAREYAQGIGALYKSGETMFIEQAKAQQTFWKDL